MNKRYTGHCAQTLIDYVRESINAMILTLILCNLRGSNSATYFTWIGFIT